MEQLQVKVLPIKELTAANLRRSLWEIGVDSVSLHNKGDLMEACFGEGYTGVDSALPQGFVNHMADDHGIDVRAYGCVDYRDGRHGDFTNLAELLVEKIRQGKFILVRVPDE